MKITLVTTLIALSLCLSAVAQKPYEEKVTVIVNRIAPDGSYRFYKTEGKSESGHYNLNFSCWTSNTMPSSIDGSPVNTCRALVVGRTYTVRSRQMNIRECRYGDGEYTLFSGENGDWTDACLVYRSTIH